MGKHTNSTWRYRTDEEGQVSVYDNRGFVVAVPDEHTAQRLVAQHNAAVYHYEHQLHYEAWASELNYACYQASRAQTSAILNTAKNLYDLATDNPDVPIWVSQFADRLLTMTLDDPDVYAPDVALPVAPEVAAR